MGRRVGAWCLSCSSRDSSGGVRQNRSPPHEDRHQAPTHPHVHPLSLQDGGGVSGDLYFSLTAFVFEGKLQLYTEGQRFPRFDVNILLHDARDSQVAQRL